MFEAHVEDVVQRARTGALPSAGQVDGLLAEAHDRYAPLREGLVADYIPALAAADPEAFAVSLVEVDGTTRDAGDADRSFSIQSISKAFVLALVCAELGHERVHEVVGVNNTGLPFDSVLAVELGAGSPRNPMVNAGAIATTALVPGVDLEDRWRAVQSGLSGFAGRELVVDEGVLDSEMRTNHRNRGLAELLVAYGRLQGLSAPAAVELYTRQCSLLVTARDLAVMGATLAAGGTNPLTAEEVVPAEVCRDTLAVLASCGMYELSGDWLFEIGLPAKSGVSGGIVAIAPGKGALGTYSPRLDPAGTSVRGQRVGAFLSRALGLNLFASGPSAGAVARGADRE